MPAGLYFHHKIPTRPRAIRTSRNLKRCNKLKTTCNDPENCKKHLWPPGPNNNNNNNNPYALSRRCVLGRYAFTEERRYLPKFVGGGFSKLYQVTSITQLFRPITLRQSSWSTEFADNNEVCDVTAAADKLLCKHLCVDAFFSWVLRFWVLGRF